MDSKQIVKMWKLHQQIKELQAQLEAEVAPLKRAALEAYSTIKHEHGAYRIHAVLKRQYKPVKELRLIPKRDLNLFKSKKTVSVPNVSDLCPHCLAKCKVEEVYVPIAGAFEAASTKTKALLKELTYSPSILFK